MATRSRSPASRSARALAACLLLAGCAETAARHLEERVAIHADAAPRPDGFHYCHGYGCDRRVVLALSPAAWLEVTAPLRRPPADAAAERRALAEAARRFEFATARLAGTDGDLGGTFPGMGREGQLDCVDEAVNMTQFLRLVEAAGLLRRHAPGRLAHRGNLYDAWPHVTATLELRDPPAGSGEAPRRFAIDAWFFDSGTAPVVVPLEAWRAGGDPGELCPEPAGGCVL